MGFFSWSEGKGWMLKDAKKSSSEDLTEHHGLY